MKHKLRRRCQQASDALQTVCILWVPRVGRACAIVECVEERCRELAAGGTGAQSHCDVQTLPVVERRVSQQQVLQANRRQLLRRGHMHSCAQGINLPGSREVRQTAVSCTS